MKTKLLKKEKTKNYFNLKENKEKKTRNARHQKCIHKKKQDIFLAFLVSVHYIKGEWKMSTRTNKQNI